MRERAWALGFLAASGAYLAVSLSFPFGNMLKPGAGFFPVGVGIFLCLAAGAVLATAQRRPPAPVAATALPEAARARVATTIVGLVGFCLLLPWLGYVVCAFLFVALLLRRLGAGRWPGVVVTAVASAALSYYVFAIALGVPLSRGALFE